jgi:hypothetical protein
MLIQCTNPHCNVQLTVPDEMAPYGGTVICPQCQITLSIAPQSAPPAAGYSSGAPQHTASSVPSAASAPAAAGALPGPAARPGSGAGVLIAVAGGMLILAAAGAIIAWMLGTNNGKTGSEAEIAKLKQQVMELQNDLKDLAELQKQRDTLSNEIRRLQQDNNAKDAKIKELEQKVEFIAEWRKPDFVLVNPHSFAVALDYDQGADSFRVLARAEQAWAELAFKIAQKAQIPRIGVNPQLTRKVFAAATPGDLVSELLSKQIKRYWRVHKYVPVSPDIKAPDFVSFRELDGDKYRLGFHVGVDGEELLVQTIYPHPERIPRNRIVPGTARVGNGDKIKNTQEIDFLDYCVLKVAQLVQSPDDQVSYMAVGVSCKTDTLDEILEYSQRTDDTWIDDYFDFYARATQTPFRWDTRKEAARAFRIIARELEDEVYAKLNRLGVPTLEREEIGEVIAERERRFDEEFEARELPQLQTATHQLILEVEKAQNGGLYRLAVRLVSVDSGAVVFADSGDRVYPENKAPANFFLDVGQVYLVEFKGTGRPMVLPPAGGPMHLPPVRLEAPESEPPRVGYIEGAATGEVIRFRDLFAKEFQELPASVVARVTPISDLKQLPRPYQMRYLMWRIAQSTLPRAGRVFAIQGDRAKISLGRPAGLKVGERLSVLRVSSSPGEQFDTRTIQPMELAIRQVNDYDSEVYVAESGLEFLWAQGEVLLPDDVVFLKGAKDIIVAILAPRLNGTILPPEKAQQFKVLGPQQIEKLRFDTEIAGLNLANQIRAGLQKLSVKLIDVEPQALRNIQEAQKHASPSDLARAVGATHIIYGDIAPLTAFAQEQTYVLQLRIVDAKGQSPAFDFPRLDLNYTQLAAWRP